MRLSRMSAVAVLIVVCGIAVWQLSGYLSTVHLPAMRYVAVFATNPSMQTEDFKSDVASTGGSESSYVPNHQGSRVEMATELFAERFMPAFSSDSRGTVVTYAGQGISLMPQAGDVKEVRQALKFVVPGAAPHSGTNIASGLRTAIDALDATDGNEGPIRKVIFAFTDGQDNDRANLDAVAGELKRKNIRLVVVALGTKVQYKWGFDLTGSHYYCDPCQAPPVPKFDQDGHFVDWMRRFDEPLHAELAEDSIDRILRFTGILIEVLPGKVSSIPWNEKLRPLTVSDRR